ncbi:hypothetical protein OROMI_028250 [Orobanche minor]
MMSGATSNISSGSTGSSTGRPRSGRVVGVPKRCWCGEEIVALISKSDHNPNRRYFRCCYAASKKLMNDNHVFKWVDEALLNEIEILQFKNARLEQELKEITTERMELEKKVFEKVRMKLENEILERFEVVLVDAKCSMKKTIVLMAIGCMIIVGCMKLVG